MSEFLLGNSKATPAIAITKQLLSLVDALTSLNHNTALTHLTATAAKFVHEATATSAVRSLLDPTPKE